MKNKLSKSISTVVSAEVERRNAEYRKVWGAAATKLMLSVGLVVLHDDFGFRKKRLQKFQDRFEDQAECIQQGFVSLEEMQQLAEELSQKINLKEQENG